MSFVYDAWYRNRMSSVSWHVKGFFSIKDLVRPLTSLAETSDSPIPRTFVLPPSGLTVLSISPILLNQILFTTMWSVLLESATKSCFVASLETLSDFNWKLNFLV